MYNRINRYLVGTLVAVVVLSTIIIGCGGVALVKPSVEADTKLIDRKTLIKKHRAFNHFTKGYLYEITGNLETSADEYRLALFYDPTSEELNRSLADVNYRLQRYNEALDLILKIKNPTLDDLLITANCYSLIGNDKMALKYFSQAAEIDSSFELPNNYLAVYYAGQGNISKAEYYYNRLIDYSENSDAWRLELASLYLKIGKEKKALKIYNEMIERDSLDNRGYLGIAVIKEDQNDTLTADSLYKYLAYQNWDDVSILSLISQSFIRLNNIEMAIEVTRRIIELYPDDYFSQWRYVSLLFDTGETQTADSVLLELTVKMPDDPLIYFYRGRIAQIHQNYASAESLYMKSIALNDTLIEAWVNLAFTRNLDNDLEYALATFDSALASCPSESLQIYYYIGVFYSREEKFSEAAEYYEKILAAQPENINVMFNLASVYERISQFDKAEELFLHLLDLEPDNAMALNYLGYMYADNNIHLDQAEKMIKKALKFIPNNGAYLDSYAWVMYRKGKYKNALKYQLKALDNSEDDAILYDHMGDIYYALKQLAQAKYNWNKALELDPENDLIKEKLKK